MSKTNQFLIFSVLDKLLISNLNVISYILTNYTKK